MLSGRVQNGSGLLLFYFPSILLVAMSMPMFFSKLQILCWKYSISPPSGTRIRSFEINRVGSPVVGTRERIEAMMTRFGELTDEVGRLEGLVEDQRRELETQNSSRLGGMYDDEDGVVTPAMVDEEEEQVRLLEEKIKAMQERV